MILLIPAIFSLGFILWRLLPQNGMLGHDYSHYYSRILIGVDHFLKNGFSVPHFTPYLCGGIPYFADPQIYYYSLPQFLAFFISPLVATYLSYSLFYVLGYWGMFKLGREFKLGNLAAHLGALGFLLNGFSFAHLFVGHANHYQFLLLPWFIVFPFIKTQFLSIQWWRNLSLFSLCVIYCFYSGAMHILVVAFAMLSLFLPSLLYFKKRDGELKSLLNFGVFALGILLLTCSGKGMASYLYSKHFAVHGIDQASTDLLTQVFRYFWFAPDSLPQFIKFGEWAFGPWEYVGFITRLSLPALLCFLILGIKYRAQKILVLTTLSLGIFWILISHGSPLNALLLFFKSYHNPLKVLGCFIVPLLLVSAWGLEQCGKINWVTRGLNHYKTAAYFLLSGIMFCEYAINTEVFLKTPGALGYQYHPEAYKQLKLKGGFPAVTEISNKSHADLSESLQGRSSLACYEPLFGYRLEKFKSSLKMGPTGMPSDYSFNLQNPACFIYGENLGCKAWDKISNAHVQDFEYFKNGREVNHWIPIWQKVLIWINVLSILGLFLPLLWSLRLRVKVEEYKLRQVSEV